jgi:DNA (cytosine-5)-methyltransferase 1
LTLRVLDLFSGIGGFSLGLERAGMRTVAFCEIDPYCRAVLRKHWPDVPIFEDVRTLTAADVGGVDVICGGFPCQDISIAGRGAGLDGERSGLWAEYARIVGDIRPLYFVVENVSALTFRGLLRILGDITALGYDAEWHCIRACYAGLPQSRDRVWIVAYAHGEELERRSLTGSPGRVWKEREKQLRAMAAELVRLSSPAGSTGGIAYGIPNRMDRLKALGNAVVPQIPEIIGRAILDAERTRAT